VAEALRGEIINADSRQIYRDMAIGTGWPSQAELERVPHHGYGVIAPDERYSAARFVTETRRLIQSVEDRGLLPIVVGGSGFYVDSLTQTIPLDRPPPDEALRARLRREAAAHPPGVLYEWLVSLRATAAAGIHPGDTYRIVRRLETVLAAAPASQTAKPAAPNPPLHAAIAVLDVARDVLHERIALRVRAMFEQGLLQEACAVRAAYAGSAALTSLGYAEALAFQDGLATHEEAIALAQRHTRQYAKRQQTWFRHMHAAERIVADDISAAAERATTVAREFWRAA